MIRTVATFLHCRHGFPPDDYLLAIVTDEADATDVLVLLVAVDDVLEEDRVDLGHVFDVGPSQVRRTAGSALLWKQFVI